MYETLLTKEESFCAYDMGDFYRVPADNRDLNYDNYFTKGMSRDSSLTEFNSDNAERLDVEQVKNKLRSLKYIEDEIAAWEKK
jgi:UDP-N-acetylglucosamine 4,6-dehydratase/5-epimerase